MRVLMVIVLLVGVAFRILFVLADLARELSRHSFLVPPDMGSSDECDVAKDEIADTSQQMVYRAGRQAVVRYSIERMRGDHIPGNSNALDDLRSAL
jgi:hypothetical protein